MIHVLSQKDTVNEVHDLVETTLEGSCDLLVHRDFSSLGCNIVLPNPVDYSHVSSMCTQPSPSPKYYLDVPIDNPMICYANVNLDYEENIFDVLDEMLIILCL